MHEKICSNCSSKYETKHSKSLYCSQKCGAAYRWSISEKDTSKPRECLECKKQFFAKPDANQQRLCSDECRRTRNSRKVREFHVANPDRENWYRARNKEKQLPDSNQIRFFRANPDAPKCCEACGEARVLEIAHRPEHERNGRGRSISNCKWPEMVWVLCPTCHRLLDRMNYPPADLGLS